jgi:hypothetical protein
MIYAREFNLAIEFCEEAVCVASICETKYLKLILCVCRVSSTEPLLNLYINVVRLVPVLLLRAWTSEAKDEARR